jgi:outer membrane receptor protein involved in Fe transport
MVRRGLWAAALVLLSAAGAAAQTSEGGLRGYVRDEHGGALPGATVTATSPDLLGPATAVTDASGYYRLINLKPGTYTISAEVSGFSRGQYPGILIRAGNTFALDISLKVGQLEEAVTVQSESPMLEISKPSNVLNFDGEFQRHMPLQSRRNWSDFLELTPGVISRSFDDGSGRQVYFGHGTEHFAHVIQLEGTLASNYHDAQVTYVGMGADMIQDIQVKTGGVDASAPMGTGLVMNVVTKSGGNQFKGSIGYAFQPFQWNGNNAGNCTPFSTTVPGRTVVSCDPAVAGRGTPTTAEVKQLDVSLGGPLKKDKVWFFAALRRADSASGISRRADEVENIRAFFPDKPLFDNTSESWQPYAKVTARLNGNHELQAFYQYDRLTLSGDREYNFEPVFTTANGGSLYGARLQSVWGQRITTTFTASYNNKGGSDRSTVEQSPGQGPQIIIHRDFVVQGNTLQGTGRILEGGNVQNFALLPASQVILRGDLTWFKEGWKGSHEFQTGFFAAPRNRYDQITEYVNDGFVLEEQRMRDPSNPAAGTVAFHRRYRDPVSLQTREAHDSNYGVYVQDTWRPSSRLTLNVGLRVDRVKRTDGIFDVTRQESLEVGPRLGFSYMLTRDAKTVLRGSVVRVHEQVMGRDSVTLFGADAGAGQLDRYDANGDGVFESEVPTAARSQTLAASEFDPDLHQPYVDEFILGIRKQFPWQISVDVAGIKRSYKHNYALVDINGIYAGPGQPFGGFGKVDPARGRVDQQTNNRWSTLEYAAIEITLAKNFSKGFQVVGGFNRQWQHMGGTWNPTDPARFVQPGAFENAKLIYMPRGNLYDMISLPITTGTQLHTYGPTWQKYSARLGATWQAPRGFLLAGSFTMVAGPWSGAIVDLLPANSPEVARFGPARTSNGQVNPLSTRMRFVRADCPSPATPECFATRDEQIQAPGVKSLGVKLAKRFRLAGQRELEVAGNVFNLLNAGNYYQYNYSGANEKFNPNFLQMRNQQPARAFQATAVLRF